MKPSDDALLENFANMLRQEMQMQFTAPVNIRQIVEAKGIIAYLRPAQDDFSGMAVKISGDTSGLFMLVNTAHQYAKQRFTACHELYHLLFQPSFESSYDTDLFAKTDNLEELKANHFASFLLLPKIGLQMLTPVEQQRKDRITMGTLLMLQHRFQCSHSALIYRLLRMGWISASYLESLKGSIVSHAREYGYSLSLYHTTNQTELIGDYNVKARELLERNVISRQKYEELLADMKIEYTELPF